MRFESSACLAAITRLTVDGVSPSYDQIKVALGLKSKSGVSRMVHQLERDGFIRRHPGSPRSIEIIKVPDLAEHMRVLVEAHGVEAVAKALGTVCCDRGVRL